MCIAGLLVTDALNSPEASAQSSGELSKAVRGNNVWNDMPSNWTYDKLSNGLIYDKNYLYQVSDAQTNNGGKGSDKCINYMSTDGQTVTNKWTVAACRGPVSANYAGTGSAYGTTTMAVSDDYAYFWYYGEDNPTDSLWNLIKANGGGTRNDSVNVVRRFAQGATQGQVAIIPDPDYFERGLNYTYWSGGEALQGTSKIMLSSGELSGIGHSFRLMIFDTETGRYNYSGKLQPATTMDNIFGDNDGGAGVNGYVASDMALDARGNAYIMVHSSRGVPAWGLGNTSRPYFYLVRVVPNENGPWKYNLVQRFDGDDGYAYWGMAFFNGKLYASFATGDIWEYNPISGNSRSISRMSGVGYNVDLASMQTAQVIEGRVYNDANADGSVQGDDGVVGQYIALYQKVNGNWVYQGMRQTDGEGDYSFLTAGIGEYAVRLVEPKIEDGSTKVNAVQTYAGIDSDESNLTAKCLNGDIVAPGGAEKAGACDGALPPGSAEPPISTDRKRMGTEAASLEIANLDNFGAYTLVNVVQGEMVIDVNFGISAAGSYGDGEESMITTGANNGPAHAQGRTENAKLWLGDEYGLSADGTNSAKSAAHTADDGISLITATGAEVPLQGTAVVTGKPYTVNATVSGEANSATVRSWITPPVATTAKVAAPAATAAPTFEKAVSGGKASATWTAPAVTDLQKVVGRFDVSPTSMVVDQPDNRNGKYWPAGRTAASPNTSDLHGWTTPGEVEDYTFYVAQGLVRVAANDLDGKGTSSYALTNISTTDPSSDKDEITSEEAGQLKVSPTIHAIKTVGQPVAITATPPTGENIVSATCTDNFTGADVHATLAGKTLTVPASATGKGSDVTCAFEYTAFGNPADSSLNVEPMEGEDPPISPNNRSFYVATTTAKAGTTLIPDQVVRYTLWDADGKNEITDANIARLSEDTCTTDSTGTCSVKVFAKTAGTYQLKSELQLGGGKLAEVGHGSPATLVFSHGSSATDKSNLAVSSNTAVIGLGENDGIVATATIKDGKGEELENVLVRFTWDGDALGESENAAAPSASPIEVLTDENGEAVITLKDLTEETVNLHAQVSTGEDTWSDIDSSPQAITYTDADDAHPVLSVTSPVEIWIGDGTKPSGAITPADFDEKSEWLDGVSALSIAGGTDITSRVKINDLADPASAAELGVDTAKKGTYTVKYSVTNSSGLSTVKYRVVVVNDGSFTVDHTDGYILRADSFIKKASEADAADSAILAASGAQAWKVNLDNAAGLTDAGVAVGSKDPAYAKDAKEGTYPITIQVAEKAAVSKAISAVVVDDDSIIVGPEVDPETGATYYLTAKDNKIRTSQVKNYVGQTDAVKDKIKALTSAKGYEVKGEIKDAPVALQGSNPIQSGAAAGTDYTVKFGIVGHETHIIEPKVLIYGTEPTIEAKPSPLEYQIDGLDSALIKDGKLTKDAILAGVVAKDEEDGDEKTHEVDIDDVEWVIRDKTGATIATEKSADSGISAKHAGVYAAEYSYTDTDDNKVSAKRAIIVNDGRILVTEDVIISARNFVAKVKDAQCDQAWVKRQAEATAYDLDGVKLPDADLEISNWSSAGFTCPAKEGDYRFNFKVKGFDPVKAATGTIVADDVVIPEVDPDDRYLVTAKNFEVTLTKAKEIVEAGDSAYVEAASARVFKLVDGIADAAAAVRNNGGFESKKGEYDITFGAKVSGNWANAAEPTVVGTVANGEAPKIIAISPVLVYTGPGEKPAGYIGWDTYAGADAPGYGITASDKETLPNKLKITVTWANGAPVQTSPAGMYPNTIKVEDEDENVVNAKQVIIINDGSGEYDPETGIFITAHDNWTKKADFVSAISANGKEKAVLTLVDAKAWQFHKENGTVTDLTPKVRNLDAISTDHNDQGYPVQVQAKEDTRENPLVNTKKLYVIDSEVVEEFGDLQLSGNNATMRLSEAQALTASPDLNAALKSALQAAALKKTQAGIEVVQPVFDNADMQAFKDGIAAKTLGQYSLKLYGPAPSTDFITLKITVTAGNLPQITGQFPVEYKIGEIGAADIDAQGNIKEWALKRSVSATDEELKSDENPTGAFDADAISVAITHKGQSVAAISATEAAAYQATFSVTDEDGNQAEVKGLIVVNDGRFEVGETTIGAHNYVIKHQDVAPAAGDANKAQVREKSGLEAYDAEGNDITDEAAFKSFDSAYSDQIDVKTLPRDFSFTFTAGSPKAVEKTVKATVVTDDTEIDCTPDGRYCILASPFTRNLAGAEELLKGSDQAQNDRFVAAANARVVKLVENAVDADAKLSDKGGYAAVENHEGYPVSFAIAQEGSLLNPGAHVTVKGIVTQGEAPQIGARNAVYNLGEKPKLGELVTVTDLEDGTGDEHQVTGDALEDGLEIESSIPVDSEGKTKQVGVFQVQYTFTDSDSNQVFTTATVVVQNPDEPWYVGDTIIEAHNYAIAAKDVAGLDTRKTQALTRTGSKQYELATGALIDNPVLYTGWGEPATWGNPGACGTEADGANGNGIRFDTAYNGPDTEAKADGHAIQIHEKDQFCVTDTKGLQRRAFVVAADVVGPDKPVGPSVDNPDGTTQYVWGNHLNLRPAQVKALIGDANGFDKAYLAAAHAQTSNSATITQVSDLDKLTGVTVTDVDGLVDAFKGSFTKEDLGTYSLRVAYQGTQITLHVTVADGNAPVLTSLVNNLDIPIASDKVEDGKLTAAAIKEKVSVTDAEDTADPQKSALEASITATRILEITETGSTEVASIPADRAGLYKVSFTATDSDGNPGYTDGMVVVNDGRYVVDEDGKYVLGANSFVINTKDVVAAQAAVLGKAKASAFTSEGANLFDKIKFNAFDANYVDKAPKGEYSFEITIDADKAPVKAFKAFVVDEEIIVDDGEHAITARNWSESIGDWRDLVCEGNWAAKSNGEISTCNKASQAKIDKGLIGETAGRAQAFDLIAGENISDKLKVATDGFYYDGQNKTPLPPASGNKGADVRTWDANLVNSKAVNFNAVYTLDGVNLKAEAIGTAYTGVPPQAHLTTPVNISGDQLTDPTLLGTNQFGAVWDYEDADRQAGVSPASDTHALCTDGAAGTEAEILNRRNPVYREVVSNGSKPSTAGTNLEYTGALSHLPEAAVFQVKNAGGQVISGKFAFLNTPLEAGEQLGALVNLASAKTPDQAGHVVNTKPTDEQFADAQGDDAFAKKLQVCEVTTTGYDQSTGTLNLGSDLTGDGRTHTAWVTSSGYPDQITDDKGFVSWKPGLYPTQMSYIDSDGNVTAKPKLIVVNDGHYSEDEGEGERVLYASSYAVPAADVPLDSTALQAQVISRSHAMAYDGVLGTKLPGIAFVDDLGSLGADANSDGIADAGDYDVRVAVPSVSGTGNVTLTIKVHVIAADVIGPNDPNEQGATEYTLGDNATISRSQARAIAADLREGKTDSLKAALNVRGLRVEADGSLGTAPKNFEFSGFDTFLAHFPDGDTNLDDDKGEYGVDAQIAGDNNSKISLKLTVSEGQAPVINFDEDGDALNGNQITHEYEIGSIDNKYVTDGKLNAEGLLINGSVYDADDCAMDGDKYLSEEKCEALQDTLAVVEIVKLDGGDKVESIPVDKPGAYIVRATATDSDSNTSTGQRIIIVNDGQYQIEDGAGKTYIVRALGYGIRSQDVVSGAAQVLTESGAKGYVVQGQNIAALGVTASDLGGLTGEIQAEQVFNVAIRPADETITFTPLTIPVRVLLDPNPAKPIGAITNGDSKSISAKNIRVSVTAVEKWVEAWQAAESGTGEVTKDELLALMNERVAARGFTRLTMDQCSPDNCTVELVPESLTDAITKAGGKIEAGDQYALTFRIKEEPSTTVDAKLVLENGELPQIEAPALIVVNQGEDLKAHKWAEGVIATDYEAKSADNPTGDISTDIDGPNLPITGVLCSDSVPTTPITKAEQASMACAKFDVDTSKAGFTEIVYTAQDSDYNHVSVTTKILVNDGTYVVDEPAQPNPDDPDNPDNPDADPNHRLVLQGYSFVTPVDEVGSDLDQDILSKSKAKAWEIKAVAENGNIEYVTAQTAVAVAENGGYKANKGTYPIKLTPQPLNNYSGNYPVADITGQVVKADEFDDGPGEGTDSARYFIWANNVALQLKDAAGLVGDTPAVHAELIRRAGAEAVKALGAAAATDVIVTANGVKNEANGNFSVTFAVKAAPEVKVTVKFTTDNSDAPVITFDTEPLEIAQTQNKHQMTEGELKEGVSATDDIDGDLTSSVKAHTVGSDKLPVIDTNNPGVYPVGYTVTDSNSNSTTEKRATVINDGRFEIEKPDDGGTAIIMGAKNFVIQAEKAPFDKDMVRSLAEAQAYDSKGNPLSVDTADLPVDFRNGVIGSYQITFSASLEGLSATKTVTGTVVKADVIYPGDVYDQYAIAANHFRVNVAEAQALIDDPRGIDAALIEAAYVRVYKLVDDVAPGVPRLVDNGGFAAVEKPEGYDLVFGVRVPTDPGTGTPAHDVAAPPVQVSTKGIVTQGTPPELEVTTPVEIELTDPPATWDRDSELDGVSYSDEEDDCLLGHGCMTDDDVLVTYLDGPVNTSKAGIYRLTYSLTDSDGNNVTAPRVVVVNDGSYQVGDKRILKADSFMVQAKKVPADKSKRDQQIISLSGARVFNATTGAELGQGDILVDSDGGYSATPATYDITVAATDGKLTEGEAPAVLEKKAIKGRVVDAEIIDGKDNVWVYGTPLELSVHEAEALVAAGNTEAKTDAILTALKAGATRIDPNGDVTDLKAVTKADQAKAFIDAFSGADHRSTPGKYLFTVSDQANTASVELWISVTSGNVPTITVTPKPLEYAVNGALDEALSRAQIIAGVVATDVEDPKDLTGIPDEPGAAGLTYTIKDGTGQPVTRIPAAEPGVYQVEYTATDTDHNQVSDSRAVVVNDGRFHIDQEYIMRASSFVIESSKVSTENASGQILAESHAAAWTIEGAPVGVSVAATGGYSKTPDNYQPKLAVTGHADHFLHITAKVLGEGGNGGNGDSYSIVGYNFRINAIDAAKLAAKAVGEKGDGATGVDLQAFSDELVARGKVESLYRFSDQLVKQGTPAVALTSITDAASFDDGGFSSTYKEKGKFDDGSKFTVVFWVGEDHSAKVGVELLVGPGQAPTITATSPLQVWIGKASDKPAGSLEPSEFDTAAKQKVGVTVFDFEDRDTISVDQVSVSTPEGAKELDLAEPGIYQLKYSVTDTDYNVATAIRVVVVNDGRFVVGDGRILTAWPTVMRKDAVALSEDGLKAQLLQLTAPQVFDGLTGEELDVPAFISDLGELVPNPDTEVGDYEITVAAPDSTPDKTIAKKVKVVIVDAEVLVPDGPDADGNTVWIYGDNAKINRAEAKKLAEGGLAEIAKALHIQVLKLSSTGEKLEPPAAALADVDGEGDSGNFIDVFTGDKYNTGEDLGTYLFDAKAATDTAKATARFRIEVALPSDFEVPSGYTTAAVMLQAKVNGSEPWAGKDIEEIVEADGEPASQVRTDHANFVTVKVTSSEAPDGYPESAVTIEAQALGGMDTPITVEGMKLKAARSGIAKVIVALKENPDIKASFTVVVPGDIDRNGVVNADDVAEAELYAAGDRTAALYGKVCDEFTGLLANANRDFVAAPLGWDPVVGHEDARALALYVASLRQNTSGLK
jgi:hypothetical protein